MKYGPETATDKAARVTAAATDSMARATKVMAYVAGGSLLLTVVSLGILVDQLLDAKEADRPWVGIALQVDGVELQKAPNATLAFVNSGRRPAKVTLTQYTWQPLTTLPDVPKYLPAPTDNSTNVIVPNSVATVTFTLNGITDATVARLKSKEYTLYVYANVEYDDPVTGNHDWTHGCWRYVYFDSGTHSGFYNCSVYNDAK